MTNEPINNRAGRLDYTGDLDIDMLDPVTREAAFRDWMVQCWLADNDPPQDADGLAAFDLGRLRHVFSHSYRAGDWQRMDRRAGANIVRALMLFALFSGKPHGLVTNRTKPINEVERLDHVWHVPAHHLVMAAGYLLDQFDDARPFHVWIHDGRHGHVIKLRKIDHGLRWFAYDETTWPGGLSMLSDGQNIMGVKATKVNWPEVGQFIVDVGGLERTIAGIGGIVPFVEMIHDLADQVEEAAQREFGIGELPSGWGDPDLQRLVLRRAVPKLVKDLVERWDDRD